MIRELGSSIAGPSVRSARIMLRRNPYIADLSAVTLLPGYYWVNWSETPEPPEIAEFREEGWYRMGVTDMSHTPPEVVCSDRLLPPRRLLE